ncbi:6-phosphogluconolactonase [Petrachloros mirabilis]
MLSVPEIRISRNRKDWATEAATLIIRVGQQAVRSRGCFSLAVSGGTTPELLYETLASAAYAERFDWSAATFFFVDERCVPPEHPDSNFNLANRALFLPLRINLNNIYRMSGESSDPDGAAREYEAQIRTACASPTDIWPRIDLVLLGLGNDGHTASLFPGTAAVDERHRWVAVGHAPSGPSTRLTLTLGVINQASVVVFLVTGADKAGIVKTILNPGSDADRQLPAALVKPNRGRLIWLIDSPAASELEDHC